MQPLFFKMRNQILIPKELIIWIKNVKKKKRHFQVPSKMQLLKQYAINFESRHKHCGIRLLSDNFCHMVSPLNTMISLKKQFIQIPFTIKHAF